VGIFRLNSQEYLIGDEIVVKREDRNGVGETLKQAAMMAANRVPRDLQSPPHVLHNIAVRDLWVR
jgi:hypothetical protein